MSKELNTVELTVETVELAQEIVQPLDNLSLALVGGGEFPVAL
ncbi:MAG: hypothetical protein ACK50D_04505 [Burkholderiales bacterium]|jgi:hypothetical protein